MAKFVPPIIQDNPDGWGPRQVPEKYKDMPYQPFSKGDRLGKVGKVIYNIVSIFSVLCYSNFLCM